MPKKRSKRSTRMNTGRKRPTHSDKWKLAAAQRRIKRLEKVLDQKNACITRLMERLKNSVELITPFPTPFLTAAPKVKASGILHSWVLDTLEPVPRFFMGIPLPRTVDQAIGWWWRKPWAAISEWSVWKGTGPR